MAESNTKIITQLITLSSIDAAINRILAEKRAFERRLHDAKAALDKIKSEHQVKTLDLKEKRQAASKEEKNIKGERDKLIARRKSLATMGDYKIQQAAEREIDATESQLERREEELLNLMMAADEVEKLVQGISSKLELSMKDFEGYQSESEQFLANIEERSREKTAERKAITATLDAATLHKYESVLKKTPTDPLAQLKVNLCGVCSMSLGAQLIVKVSRGETLEQCPGCYRILHLPQA